MNNIFSAKVWISSNGQPLIKLEQELINAMPIELDRTLLVIRKEKSIEIFNAEIPIHIMRKEKISIKK